MSATNDFASYQRGFNSPGIHSFAITGDDNNDLSHVSRVRVDVAGTVKFTTLGGDTDTWTCVAGEIIPLLITRVFATGTSATGLHGIY